MQSPQNIFKMSQNFIYKLGVAVENIVRNRNYVENTAGIDRLCSIELSRSVQYCSGLYFHNLDF